MTTPSSPGPSAPPEPARDPGRPTEAGPAALFDAIAAEHAAIYGYGLVSAHVKPTENKLVSQAVAEHRGRREAAVALLAGRSVSAPLPEVGYQLPLVVDSPANAARLAIRMEGDCAVAWRAVLEQSDDEPDRAFGATALTQCALMAARWRQVLGAWPVTEAFPGGGE